MNKYWFKPKRYGYGAYPSTWEGWLVTLIFVLFVAYRAYSVHSSRLIFELIVYAVIIIYITKIKTEEKWKWRWGKL